MKAVIFRDSELLAFTIVDQGRETVAEVARRALDEAASKARIKMGDIPYVGVTGMVLHSGRQFLLKRG